jgi:hypothetical protein
MAMRRWAEGEDEERMWVTTGRRSEWNDSHYAIEASSEGEKEEQRRLVDKDER